jgi:tRNA1Val (adenine37-N6)-methyltransferase
MPLEDYAGPRYRVDDLQRAGFCLCQDTQGFRFGVDAVLLADFAAERIHARAKVMDLCCGNGVVSVLLVARKPDLRITGVEIDEGAAGLARHNMALNGLSGRVDILCADAKSLPRSMNGAFDALAVNPPYLPAGSIKSRNAAVDQARREVSLGLAETAAASAALLRERGRFFMVHQAQRAVEAACILTESGLSVKAIRFVHPAQGEKAVLALFYAVKGAGQWVDVLDPLYIRDKHGAYTEEIHAIYGTGATSGEAGL